MASETIADLLYNWSLHEAGLAAFYYPKDGEFVPMSHGEARQMAFEIGVGLWALGLRKGDRVSIMAQTRYEWDLVDAGAMMMGFVVVAIYPTSTAEQTSFILDNSSSKIAILEDRSHWEKVAPALQRLPDMEHVILIESHDVPAGNWLSLSQLRERGRQALASHPTLPEQSVAAVKANDLAGLVYTSGTTGLPKGVSLAHGNLYAIAKILSDLIWLEAGDTSVIYLPLSHIMARLSNYYGKLKRMVPYFAPAITALIPTCHAAHPRSITAAPRIFEKIHVRIMAIIAQRPEAVQATFKEALALGIERARLLNAGQPVPAGLEERYQEYDLTLFKPIRSMIFGDRIESAFSGSAPISIELLEFFHAIGIPILEGYGLTETSSPITLNLPQAYRLGTVGKPLPGCTVKIAPDGEILLKGPGAFNGYYNNMRATDEAFTDDGWFRSGDIGALDQDGYLRITDRKKNLIITAGGKNIAPAPIEQRLIQHPLISQALLHGDKRKYLTALLTLDPQNLQNWAQKEGKAMLSLAELAADSDISAEIQHFVDQVNSKLARYETIKYFRILPEEFTVDNGFLTPSMKVRRKKIEKAFGELLDEMMRP